MDLAGAYPARAGLVSSWREAFLDREAGTVTIQDDWTFESPRRMTLVLMTAHEPEDDGSGAVRLGAARLRFDARRLSLRHERLEIDDEKLRLAWGPAVHRLLLTERDPAAGGSSILVLERADADAS